MNILSLLQPGVTQPFLDASARASWLAAVHQSMRAVGGAVTADVEEPIVGRNYYRVGVDLRDGSRLNLLLNAAASLVAATERHDPHTLAAAFVDVPGGDTFSQAGLRVATAAELHQPLDEPHLKWLAPEEARDVGYHQPSRLGDLLFNWFD
jgi:hypothetical protein